MNSGQNMKVEKLETDVVVIGAGGCGLAAAISIREKGARVIVVEKQAPGGNTALAHGLFAAESAMQKRMGINTTKDECFRIAMNDSHWKINPRIFRAFLNKTADTIQWLEDKGLVFTNVEGKPFGGGTVVWHVWKRRGTLSDLMKVLFRSCDDLGVQILKHCPAKKILTEESGKVTGVIAGDNDREVRISARSVIIASGGYGANKELLRKHFPYYSDKMVYIGVPNKGDGLQMAIEAGAATEDLGQVLLHPHFYRGSRYIQGIAGGYDRIWVNKRGERFTDEDLGSMTFALAKQPDTLAYVIFDDKMKQQHLEEQSKRAEAMGGPGLPDMDNEFRIAVETGDVKISDTLEEIAEWMNVKPEVLDSTMEEYNQCCDRGKDEIFGKDRKYLVAMRTPPYYAVRCHLHYLTTLGGIKINHHMEVINTQDEPIGGLYAGGDAASGWECDFYCIELRGHALAFAINSGRIAGENAVKYVLES
jgi:fumarate reductase flavoprotein subunit